MSFDFSPQYSQPRFSTAQYRLLEQLCNACAVSGDEAEVRAIVLKQVESLAEEIKVDPLGNVLVTKPGRKTLRRNKGHLLRVMLAAHMDEIGFMLTQDEGKGIFRFDTVGGIDVRQVVGKPVWVGKDHIPGVIGAKPIHLTTPKERQSAISLDSLRIDIGPVGNSKIKIGDRAAFATRYARIGPSIRAKALDDRLGVATLIELLRYAPENIDLLAAFTVQEEVGLRGAQVAAYAFDPDLAIAIDSTPAYDLPGWESGEDDAGENTRYNTRLDAGPAIYLADGATLSDPRLVRHMVDTAESAGIPYQFRQPGGGGTDAGAIHRSRAGVPSVSVSIPGRYAHTSAGMIRISDWKHTLGLLHTALANLTPDVLSGER